MHGNGSAAGNRVRLNHTVKLYVGNISFTITEADLHHIFEQFGSVREIKVITDRETGQPRGFAFVTMSNEPEGRAAIKNLDGKEFGGRPLKVSEARPKEDWPTRSRHVHGDSESKPLHFLSLLVEHSAS